MTNIKMEDFINTLEDIGNLHDFDTDHGTRTCFLALEIGKRLPAEFNMNDKKMLLLSYAARIHDLGRVGIDNNIMSKPGRLTKSQRAAVKEHCQIGYDLLKRSNLPAEITLTVLYHQEHWDGSGYPKGLVGLDIPLFARIICIADTYDAIRAKRPYHNERTAEEALEEMNRNISWFDPMLYSIFLDVLWEAENGRRQ